MIDLRKLVVRTMRKVAKDIEAGNCEITEDEAMEILSVISHQPLSKDQACEFLNMSRSKFDGLVREGKIPKGRKVSGYKAKLGNKDVGFTYTDYNKKTSIVGIADTSSQEQLLNTIVHEAKHVQSHICEYYNVPEDGEQAAYLIGYIVQKMHKVFRNMLYNGIK